MVSRLLVLPLAIAVALAGCVGASEPVSPAKTNPSVPTTPPVDANHSEEIPVIHARESFDFALSHVRASTLSLTTGSKNCLDIAFDHNATVTGGNATLTWTAANQFSQRLEARFYDSTNKTVPVSKAIGPSPLTVEIPAWGFTNRSSPRIFIQVPVGENAVVRDLPVKLDLHFGYASIDDPIYTIVVCSAAT